ncbi:hypothetical protein TNCV_4646061 [Trichonephila clavipes]|nr:hypothetical protein TNCV_4646061 [Trichonephila clavipes]
MDCSNTCFTVRVSGAVDLREYQCSKPATGLQVLPGKEHRYWSVESWKGVAWSDESRFLVLTADGGGKYDVKFMKAWILHARWEMFKGLAAQSWSGVFFSVPLFVIFGACASPSLCYSIRRVAG